MRDPASDNARDLLSRCHRQDHFHGSFCICLHCVASALHDRDLKIADLGKRLAVLSGHITQHMEKEHANRKRRWLDILRGR